MRWDLPPETTASAHARADVATDWLDADTFEALLSPDALQGRTLQQCMQSDDVLGVWIAERRLYLFPPWQLDPAGTPRSGLSTVLALLRGQYGVSDGRPTSGWEELEWLVAPHALLHGRTPSDMLALEPGLVINAARQDFSAWSAEARW